MAIILQASLFCKPSLSLTITTASSSKRYRFRHSVSPPRHHSSSPPPPPPRSSSSFSNSRFSYDPLLIPCALQNVDSEDSKLLNNSNPDEVSEPEVSKKSEVVRIVEEVNDREDNLGNNQKLVENQEGAGAAVDSKKIPLMVFLMGVWARLRRGIEKLMTWDWLSWWPFWRQEKRIEQLIAEANANPKDPAKQTALLSELNKQSPEAVIKRFEQRDHEVDSRGVVEYLRALVATNAITEYLPDEQSGKPTTLPALLQELQHRASRNTNEPFLNPGVSEKQPLHVVMVDPKVSNKSRFAQELISTILFTVAVGLVWLMGAAALQKYIGSLGGIGTSGVGSSSSYAPKELNKEVMPEKNVKTFKDVKGCDDAKQELVEVVEYLKNPSKFTRLGGKLPKGILLTGAPGTGKTLLAKAIAGEAGVPFFYRAGSEFEEMFVGVGARRVRSLFQAAKKKAPCIIFIDEIDAVGSTRKQWEGHTKKTLHQLLVEMDGFEQNEGIILMAATNLPDILDPALTRPGRFDRHIVVPNPDVRGRQEILELYLQDKPLADDVDVKAIARGTPGFNGADLANLVNIAAIKAAVDGGEKLTATELEFAKDRILMGTERKTMFISEESKKLTAYHESGHAIVAFNTEGAHPIHKATIMPRGSALGMVTQLPSSDETSVSQKQLLARLDVCMGGRVAEELIFGRDHITTGASSDLHSATELAHYMVSNCGMSDAIGPVHIKDRPSSEMQSRIDAEVVKLLREAYDRVKALLKSLAFALPWSLIDYEAAHLKIESRNSGLLRRAVPSTHRQIAVAFAFAFQRSFNLSIMHPCPSASHLLHSLMMDFQSSSEFNDAPQMLPPPPGTFVDREELIQHVGDFAVSQGYVVTIKQSKRDRVVVLGCDRGGVYRNRRKPVDESSAESLRQRKTGSRLTNCPFEAVGKKDDGLWKLSIKNGAHNHEPLKDLSEHPSARRFTEREVLLIKEMTEAGLKPRQILKRLRQSNPELLSTPKHVYNVKAKLRQGNVTVRNFKSLRPQKTAVRNNYQSVMEPSWRQRNPPRVPNLIGGRFVDSKSLTSIDVVNPATQLIVSQVPLSTNEEVRAAVFAAKRAFSSWRNTPVTNRQRIMFKFQELIRRDMDKLAMEITSEHGKTLTDAYNDVLCGLEIVEHACGVATLQIGEFVSNISNGVDTYSIREPLGVCAGICSFDFPAMTPLWMFPIAVTCGNTFILKPSEKVPGAAVILAELAVEAGLPNGVLNIVHGTDDIINAICDDDDVKAIALVGPNSDVADIYSRASAKGKRIQCNNGAKNHAVVMPDASIDATLSALVAAGFGGAGQKCMALTTVVYVGGITPWEDKLVEHAKAIKVNAGTESNADLGPVISKQEKERICRLIQVDTESGAKLLLDGRNILVPGYENGNFIGPTILSDVTVNMECYKEDVFGPVLLCMQAESIDEAIEIVNRNRHGSGASIFTTSAVAARKFQIEIAVGQVGINVPISVQPPFTLFTSSKPCFAGDLNCDGKGGIHFYTQIKTVTQQWKDLPGNVETPTSNSNGESLQLLNS